MKFLKCSRSPPCIEWSTPSVQAMNFCPLSPNTSDKVPVTDGHVVGQLALAAAAAGNGAAVLMQLLALVLMLLMQLL
eukprot:490662-Lingulodinium_polyedra.AAC.1